MSTIVKRTVIAEHGEAIFERRTYGNGGTWYIVDTPTNEAGRFRVSHFSGDAERRAYAQAARLYNSLVTDAECIPLF